MNSEPACCPIPTADPPCACLSIRTPVKTWAGRTWAAIVRSRGQYLPVERKAHMKEEKEQGPRRWLQPILESSYARLQLKNAPAPLRPVSPGAAFSSMLVSGAGEEMLAQLPPSHWRDTLAEYKRRKAAVRALPAAMAVAAPAARNWSPLGPSVLQNGQADTLPPVGGRTSGLAVARNGLMVYAASANGGVFKSTDAGMSWHSLMDAFDVEPTDFASTCLSCGAIAIDLSDPNRVYVGTGEGDTNAFFSQRIVNALPSYRGIGPIRSDDGGQDIFPIRGIHG